LRWNDGLFPDQMGNDHQPPQDGRVHAPSPNKKRPAGICRGRNSEHHLCAPVYDMFSNKSSPNRVRRAAQR
jgi:hypothetical protein